MASVFLLDENPRRDNNKNMAQVPSAVLSERFRAALTALREEARIAAELRDPQRSRGMSRYDLMAIQGDLQAYQPECERITRIAARRSIAIADITDEQLAMLLASTPSE